MSYIRLNIIDGNQAIHDDVHGYFGDVVVAALVAELETMEELGAALARMEPHFSVVIWKIKFGRS